MFAGGTERNYAVDVACRNEVYEHYWDVVPARLVLALCGASRINAGRQEPRVVSEDKSRGRFSMHGQSTVLAAALAAAFAFAAASPAAAEERTVKITGFGAKSGVVRVFGINSEAALKAAAEEINKAGGVTLGDGSKAKLTVEFLDDRCNAEEGISVVRRIASTDAFVAVGPTCSNVSESFFS